MAIFLSVHGSIELNDEQLPQLKTIIEANEDNNPYVDSWLVHEKGGWSSFAFFGHTINQTALDAVRSQIRRIATTVKSVDGEFTDFVTGCFRVTKVRTTSGNSQMVDFPNKNWPSSLSVPEMSRWDGFLLDRQGIRNDGRDCPEDRKR